MHYQISGFWRRVGAFLIDTVILGAVGLLLGLIFYRQFAELGGWGRAVGFPIAAMYFAILNSRFGNGQTIGKKVLKIQVVDKNGELINLPKSMLRYSVVGIPYFLNGTTIPQTFLLSVWTYILSILIFGFGLSIMYLLIFNRNTRQSLHDVIAGTYVVRKSFQADEPVKTIWPVHYVICGILMFLSLLVPFFAGQLSKNNFFAELSKTREEIQKLPQVIDATILDGQSTSHSPSDGSKITSYLSTQVLIKNRNIDDEHLAAEIADIILETHREAPHKNTIQVILAYGYDIGIASGWKKRHYSFSPDYLKSMKPMNRDN